MTENKKLILVIEDEEDTAAMFEDMLTLNGFEVIKILQSSTALEVIEEKNPDAILLDLMMPEMSGMEILRAIKQKSELKNIPIIVISAKAYSDNIRDGFEAGAAEYLTKPVTFQTLRKTLDKQLQTSNKN